MTDFRFEGQDASGNPTALTFPCQRQDQPHGERCKITISPQTNDRGNAWFVSGTQDKPTVYPDIVCGDPCGCKFQILDGEIVSVEE